MKALTEKRNGIRNTHDCRCIKKSYLKAIYQDSGDKITFSGEKELKMTDFNVTPPTAMFGAIKSGDDITIKYDVVFTRNNNLSYK